MVDLALKPLENSFAVNTLEDEVRNIAVRLYNETLKATADEINVYGSPHLGGFSQIERHVIADGLAVLRQGDEAAMRYLFKAWKYRNPRRGTHFLRTYLQILFGGDFEISKLYQLKTGVYPVNVKTEDEIRYDAEQLADYLLTSRVRVDLGTDIVPERLLKPLFSTVAARIILEIRIARRVKTELVVATTFNCTTLCYMAGQFRRPRKVTP